MMHRTAIMQECKEIIRASISKAQDALDEAFAKKKFAGETRARALAFAGEILMSQLMDAFLPHQTSDQKL